MRDSLSIIIAPDSFKGSASARSAAEAIARGWRRIRPDDTIALLPQADGGEGTLDVVASAIPGAERHKIGPVTGPDGRPTPGEWVELPGKAAVIELAQCSALPLMQQLDPLHATTRGVGEVIRAALDSGVNSLVIALGGSASTDGGSGALAALGLGLFDHDGIVLEDGGGALSRLTSVQNRLMPPPLGGVTLLVDVMVPLLGPTGASAVFGPQKGASASDVVALEKSLSVFATHLGGNPDAPGSGAAGGTGYGFATVWGARSELGATYLQRLTGLEAAIGSADVVITGEGRFDDTSTTGKVVGELLSLATAHDVSVGIIAGVVAIEPSQWVCELATLAGSAIASLTEPLRYLELAGEAAAHHFGEDL